MGASADLVTPLANMLFAALKVAHERTEQDQSNALERTAIIYVRQSTPAQVRDNRES